MKRDEKKIIDVNIHKMKRILITQTAFIGDVILITPLIREVKKLFPEALIDVMVIPQTANILENNPHINSIILFNKRENKVKEFIKTLLVIRKNHYSASLSPHSSVTTAILIWLGNIPIRIGFARWTAQHFLTNKVEHIKNTFKINKNLHLLSVFSDNKFPIETEMFPTNKMEADSKLLLAELKENTKRIVSIAPGSNWFTKRWPLEYYKEVVEKLNKLNYGIVFIGSKEERGICEEIKPPNNYLNTAGELSLIESASLIKNCDLMICNDSGAMHIANAVKTDVFVFFGPTVGKIGYFPIGKNDKVFEQNLDCRPCSSHGTAKCPLEHFNCMRLTEPETIVIKVEEKIGF